MLNPVTATGQLTDRDAHRRPAGSLGSTDARFTPLLTRAVTLAITQVQDELGRPLVGVFVPDGDLLLGGSR